MNLRSPKAESIATYLDLRARPARPAANSDRGAGAHRSTPRRRSPQQLATLPEVARVMTLEELHPRPIRTRSSP